jgi:tRNA A37 threonylcarbamoyltransferase TsaD
LFPVDTRTSTTCPVPANSDLLGRTLDDAAGEAFDKIAKLLNLPYPGGKYIDVLAGHGTADPRLFSKPYLHNDNCDFSFSGLKTAVALYVQKKSFAAIDYTEFNVEVIDQEIKDLCATVNDTIVETLLEKTRRALRSVPGQDLVPCGWRGGQQSFAAKIFRVRGGPGTQIFSSRSKLLW